jgi:hypothetical protein
VSTFTYASLRDEISNDPDTIGYSVSGVRKTPDAILALINGPTSTTTPLTFVPRDVFLRLVAPSAFSLAALAEPAKTGWATIVGIAQATDGVNVSDAAIAGLLASAHAAGLLTDVQFTALTTRPLTRAEVLWSDKLGVPITPDDIARAN